MSIQLPPFDIRNEVDSDSEEEEEIAEEVDEDQTWDDWVEDEGVKQPCKSLFENKVLVDAGKTVEYDRAKWGFDFEKTSKALNLDFHQRTRLVNYIRKTNSSPDSLKNLRGNEPFFSDDTYLYPVIPDDPLLFESSDWSDSDSGEPSAPSSNKEIAKLRAQLSESRGALNQLRALVKQKLNVLTEDDGAAETSVRRRDDDTHYFESYGNYEIHATMIQDTVRTSSYATFILSNPHIFENATVMDVGCGTGILSLLAAKAGAKRVWAIEASEEVAKKAEIIVKENEYDDVITIVHGKMEDLSLPDLSSQVDIIISEWMGYALLYESMLPSVLLARDRYLKPGGIMAPSQCRIFLSLVEIPEIIRERVEFWDDVYGFKMGVFKDDVLQDAVVDVVSEEEVVCDIAMIKDLHLHETTPRSLDFIAPFTLTSSVNPKPSSSNTTAKSHAHAFLLYFDTFFSPSGTPVPPTTAATVSRIPTADVMQPRRKASAMMRRSSSAAGGTKGKEISFTTGPGSMPTHWKQTLFLLKSPVELDTDTKVTGTFHCRRSETNPRELNVELHYSVIRPHEEVEGEEEKDEPPPVVVQMFKVR